MTQLALTLDEAEHAYALDGVRIPSVTQILSFGQDLSRIPAWTSLRGTAFHLATEYDDAGDLDESSVDPLVRPHLSAYRKWKAATNPEFTHTEVRVWGQLENLKFAGTLDRVTTTPSVLDVKSGAPRREHGAQIAAYSAAWLQRTGQETRHNAAIYCGKDGDWKVVEYGAECLQMFIDKLRAYYKANA